MGKPRRCRTSALSRLSLSPFHCRSDRNLTSPRIEYRQCRLSSCLDACSSYQQTFHITAAIRCIAEAMYR